MSFQKSSHNVRYPSYRIKSDSEILDTIENRCFRHLMANLKSNLRIEI